MNRFLCMKRDSSNPKILVATILSMSLLTVMAGAAVAPALNAISAHFADANPLLIQFVVSMPALFIILTNLCFPMLCRVMRTRTIALCGLLLYVVAGSGAFFADNIAVLLVLRALLGVSVGMIMPLSTGLLAYYFPPEEQARLMGLAAAMNQMGGVVATFLAGMLAAVSWNYAFLVYLLGLIAVVLVMLFLPNERLSNKGGISLSLLKKFHPSVVGMFLVMILFFIYPTNFAVVANQQLGLRTELITIIMAGLDVVAFFVGMVFGGVMNRFRQSVKYFAPVFFLMGYAAYLTPSVAMLVLGSVFVGIANGVGVPYLNTIASIKGGKNSATTVMPLLSAALYLGQFVSPIVVTPASRILFGQADLTGPYKVGIVLCLIFLVQVYFTRHFQSLPPNK